ASTGLLAAAAVVCKVRDQYSQGFVQAGAVLLMLEGLFFLLLMSLSLALNSGPCSQEYRCKGDQRQGHENQSGGDGRGEDPGSSLIILRGGLNERDEQTSAKEDHGAKGHHHQNNRPSAFE